MKHSRNIINSILLTVVLISTSCSTSKIVFDVINPAEVEIPGGIENTIAINLVSLTMDDKVNEITDMLKGKGELVNQIASQGALAGMKKELEMITRSQMDISAFTNKNVTDTGQPVDLSWNTIDSICLASGKQSLIVLNSFDSRTEIDYSGYERRVQTDPVKVWTNTIAYDVATDYVYVARLKAYAEVGWKIFYPANQEIILDRVYIDSVFTESEGMSKDEAERMLPGIKNAVEDAGYIAGSKFAEKIVPGRTTVERKYFTSGTDEFKQANKFIKMRYWKQAGEFWQKSVNDPNPKVSGSAKYNLALILEMEGKIDEAIELVESAKVSYPNGLIEEYLQILSHRKQLTESSSDK